MMMASPNDQVARSNFFPGGGKSQHILRFFYLPRVPGRLLSVPGQEGWLGLRRALLKFSSQRLKWTLSTRCLKFAKRRHTHPNSLCLEFLCTLLLTQIPGPAIC